MKHAKRDLERRKTEFYERRSEFERHDGTVSGKFKLVLNVIEPTEENILEVGCGDGCFLKIVTTALRPKMACGIDISKRALQTAKNSGAELMLCDIDDCGLPFKDEYFDLIICLDVIEHLFDPDFFLMEVFRVLKWEGILVLTTPNLASWYNRICLFLGWQPFWTEVSTRFVLGNPVRKMRVTKEEISPSGHLRVFTTKALRELVEKYDLSVEITTGYPFFSTRFLGLIDSILSKDRNLASFVLVKAKKKR